MVKNILVLLNLQDGKITGSNIFQLHSVCHVFIRGIALKSLVLSVSLQSRIKHFLLHFLPRHTAAKCVKKKKKNTK